MVLFLVFSALVANPNNYFLRANPARGLLIREKKEIEKVYQCPPPPPALLVRRKQSENHATHLHAPRRNAGLVPSRACTKISSTCRLGQWCRFGRFYASVCDDNFTSLSASLFFWRCLAARLSLLPSRGHEPPPRPPRQFQLTPQPITPSLSIPLCRTPGMSFYLGGGARLVCFFLYTFPPNPVLPYSRSLLDLDYQSRTISSRVDAYCTQ